MLHLLPEEHRQKVVNEYRKRVILVFLLGLFSVSIISAVFILPTFFVSYGRYSVVSMKNQMLDSELATQAGAGSSESIKEVTQSIEALRMFDNTKSVSVILDNIVRQKASGVQIKNLIFTPGENFSMTIDLAGRADTRKSLVAFDENLKANSLFDEVIVPLGSFAKDKNIDFSMKLVVSTSTKNNEE
jgi:hypothetical protein